MQACRKAIRTKRAACGPRCQRSCCRRPWSRAGCQKGCTRRAGEHPHILFPETVPAMPQGHLDEARELRPKVPAQARPLLLPAVACGLYLDALQRFGFDPFAPALQRGGFSPLWHQLAVKWRLLRGAY